MLANSSRFGPMATSAVSSSVLLSSGDSSIILIHVSVIRYKFRAKERSDTGHSSFGLLT
jgi:hypothetical protein